MSIFKSIKSIVDTKHKYTSIKQLDKMNASEIININPNDIGYYLLDPAITNESNSLKKIALEELKKIKNNPDKKEKIIRNVMKLIHRVEDEERRR